MRIIATTIVLKERELTYLTREHIMDTIKRFFICLSLCIAGSVWAQAKTPTDDLILYWSFNYKETAPDFLKPNMLPRGYSGGSLRIEGESFPIILDDPIRIQKGFSIAFWFKMDSPEANTALFSLEAENGTPFLDMSIKDQTVQANLFGTQLNHYPYMILSSDWAMVALNYDGRFVQLTLFADQLTSTSRYSLPDLKVPEITVVNLGGAKGKSLQGAFDELMFYSRPLDVTEIESMYEGNLPNASTASVVPQPKKTSSNQSLIEVTNTASSAADRWQTKWVKELTVDQTNLMFEIENWKKLAKAFDVFLNGKKVINGATDPAGLCLLVLEPDETNDLELVPLEDSDASFELKSSVWNGSKRVERLNADIPPRTRLLFHLTHRSPNQAITEIQHTVYATQRHLRIEVWDDKLLDGDFVSVYCNGQKLIDYAEVTKEPLVAEFDIEANRKNIITFVSEDSGKHGNNSARVRIVENDQLLDEFSFTASYRKKAGLLIQLRQKQ